MGLDVWLNFIANGIIHPQSIMIIDSNLINSNGKWITVLPKNTMQVLQLKIPISSIQLACSLGIISERNAR